MASKRDLRLNAAIRTAERAQAQIDRILSLPDEPTTDDPDGALVIWFQRTFHGGDRKYTYASCKASDGFWYTTGPRSPSGYTWDDLIDWIMQGDPNAQVWVADGWEPLV